MTEQDESPARVLVLNGPNLSRLGKREPDIYGAMNYDQLVEFCTTIGADMNLDVEVRQTDSESELIGWIHEAVDSSTPVVLNPAAFTHYDRRIRATFIRTGFDGHCVALGDRHSGGVCRRELRRANRANASGNRRA